MRVLRLLLITSVLLSFSGCATLIVDVDVYGEEVPGPPAKTKVASLVQKLRSEPALDQIQRNLNYRIFIEEYRNNYIVDQTPVWLAVYSGDQAKATKEAATAWDGSEGIQPLVDKAWAALASPVRDVISSLNKLDASIKVGTDEDIATNAYEGLLAAIGDYNEAANLFVANVRQAIPVGTPALKLMNIRATLDASQLVAISGLAISARVEGPVVAYPIFDPKFKSITDDSDDWIDFYEAKFTTFGGSARFVVVREGMVVFRQKSLDFDPTPVIGAGAAVTKLGLQVAASMASGRLVSTSPAKTPGGKDTVTEGNVVTEAQVSALRSDLAERESASIQALNSLAQLHREMEAKQSSYSKDDIVTFKDELASIVRFYQGRIATAGGIQ